MSDEIVPFACEQCGALYPMGTKRCPYCVDTHKFTANDGEWSCSCGQKGFAPSLNKCPFDGVMMT